MLKAPPAAPPAGFAIASPARVALDFLDTANGLGRTTQEVADPTLRSVNVVQAGNRTRVVLNLNKPQTFETQVEGNVVLVTLFDQSEQLDAKAQTVQRFAETRPATSSTRCATSTSVAATTARAASSSTCPTTRPGSTSASRARR